MLGISRMDPYTRRRMIFLVTARFETFADVTTENLDGVVRSPVKTARNERYTPERLWIMPLGSGNAFFPARRVRGSMVLEY